MLIVLCISGIHCCMGTTLHSLPKNFNKLLRRILITKYFAKGWGQPQHLMKLFGFRKILEDQSTCRVFLDASNFEIHTELESHTSAYTVCRGHFLSPFAYHYPELVPGEARVARFQAIFPKRWKDETLKPVCIHLAGTGDHNFWRRRYFLAEPLLKDSIGSIILENPFYGCRKPKEQRRSSLLNVTDLFVMGGCLIFESMALLDWCESKGFGPLGVTGISMGGHMASLAASCFDKPVALIPCLSWSTASCVFTQGIMAGSISWETLQSQYADQLQKDLIMQLLKYSEKHIAQSDAFVCGRQFTASYPHSLDAQNTKLLCEQSAVESEKPEIRKTAVVSSDKTMSVPWFQSAAPTVDIRQSTNSGATDSEVLEFMRGVLDEYTHLGNYPVPVDQSLIITVTAHDDAYVPREGVTCLSKLWPNAEIRYIPGGHVKAYLFSQKTFKIAIIDALNKAALKYHNTKLCSKK